MLRIILQALGITRPLRDMALVLAIAKSGAERPRCIPTRFCSRCLILVGRYAVPPSVSICGPATSLASSLNNVRYRMNQ